MNKKIVLVWLGLWLVSISLFGQTLKGHVERFKIYSKAIAGNLIGDSPNRDVSIYLPPGYHRETDRRYPVVYFLHGFSDSDAQWYGFQKHWIHLPRILDSTMAASLSKEMIFVTPNAYNAFKGSMYSNSVTIGDWETFVCHELINYIDSHFRTIPLPESRGLAGHSMGGYGTLRLAMKFPDIFSSVYVLSPCCMGNDVNENPELIKNIKQVTSPDQITEQPFFVSAALARAAAWSPNPQNPPLFLDLPYLEEGIDPAIKAKMDANSTLHVIDQYVYNLKRLEAIAVDVGNQDRRITINSKVLNQVLTKYQIPHAFEVYEGDHVNRIGERIQSEVLPFFSRHLSFHLP